MLYLLESCKRDVDHKTTRVFTKESCLRVFTADTISALFRIQDSEDIGEYKIMICKPYLNFSETGAMYGEHPVSREKRGSSEEQGRQRISKAKRKKMKREGSAYKTAFQENFVTTEKSLADSISSSSSIDVPAALRRDANATEALLLVKVQRRRNFEIEGDTPSVYLEVSSSIDTCISLYEALSSIPHITAARKMTRK